jgi:hypothetical protein
VDTAKAKLFSVTGVREGISAGIKAFGVPEMVRRTGLTAESLTRIACGANVRRSTLLAAAAGLELLVAGPAALSTNSLPRA